MATAVLTAAVQTSSGPQVQANLALAGELVERAAARGARLVVLPEHFGYLAEEDEMVAHAESLERPGPILRAAAGWARRWELWLLAGTIAERTADPLRVHNTAVLFDPRGALVAWYRKIHLFDAAVAGGHHESRSVVAGDVPVTASSPFGPLGLSVCYDLRFPELYAHLVAAGARTLLLAAAFTLETGRDHWHMLLRARAIENHAVVVAAAQSGERGGFATYGHSLIVDRSGTVIAEAPDGPGLALAEVDFPGNF